MTLFNLCLVSWLSLDTATSPGDLELREQGTLSNAPFLLMVLHTHRHGSQITDLGCLNLFLRTQYLSPNLHSWHPVNATASSLSINGHI